MPNLQRSRLSAAYQRRLRLSLAVFSAWCARSSLNVDKLATDGRQMSQALVRFIQQGFDSGLSKSLVTHAVLAVQTQFRELKGHLRVAWDSLWSWQLLQPVRSRRPMSNLILESLCAVAALHAMELERSHMQLWLCFITCLRVHHKG